MDNNIKTLAGFKDNRLEIDPKFADKAVDDQGPCIIVHLLQTYPLHCPKCGRLMLKNGFKEVNYQGPTVHYQPVIWSIRKQKYICKPSRECPATVTQVAEVSDVPFRHHIAQLIKQRLACALAQNKSQKDVANDFFVSDWTVRRILLGLDKFFQPNWHWLPRHIAFDDFKSERFAPSGMSMILMNIENKRTLDVILSRRSSYLRNYFLRYDRVARFHVQTVTVDLFSPYRCLIAEVSLSTCNYYCRSFSYRCTSISCLK